MQVVLVNGPAGVGKTTVGRRLAATAANGICIHGDDLKRFVVARDPRTVATGLSYAGGAALADVYLQAGYELVVFEFVFPSGRHVARFRDALRTPAPVHLLTLWAPLTTVTAREPPRPHREPLGSLVTQSWRELFANLADSARSSTRAARSTTWSPRRAAWSTPAPRSSPRAAWRPDPLTPRAPSGPRSR